jgi:hypothetical protein
MFSPFFNDAFFVGFPPRASAPGEFAHRAAQVAAAGRSAELGQEAPLATAKGQRLGPAAPGFFLGGMPWGCWAMW